MGRKFLNKYISSISFCLSGLRFITGSIAALFPTWNASNKIFGFTSFLPSLLPTVFICSIGEFFYRIATNFRGSFRKNNENKQFIFCHQCFLEETRKRNGWRRKSGTARSGALCAGVIDDIFCLGVSKWFNEILTFELCFLRPFLGWEIHWRDVGEDFGEEEEVMNGFSIESMSMKLVIQLRVHLKRFPSICFVFTSIVVCFVVAKKVFDFVHA